MEGMFLGSMWSAATAEHFLAMVEAMPDRLADFEIFRAPEEGERHLRHAVELLLDGIRPR